jgi:hypothetical protein
VELCKQNNKPIRNHKSSPRWIVAGGSFVIEHHTIQFRFRTSGLLSISEARRDLLSSIRSITDHSCPKANSHRKTLRRRHLSISPFHTSWCQYWMPVYTNHIDFRPWQVQDATKTEPRQLCKLGKTTCANVGFGQSQVANYPQTRCPTSRRK